MSKRFDYVKNQSQTMTKNIASKFLIKKNDSIENFGYTKITTDITDKPALNLYDCLKNYTTEEIIEMKCEKCKNENVKVKKNTNIWDAPNILIIVLKRFIYSDSGIYKNKTFVYFQNNAMDINAFISNLNIFRENPIDSVTGMQNDIINGNYVDRPIYDLFAMINHNGEMANGHYCSFVKSENDWYFYDDAHCIKIDEKSLDKKNAYVLFYRKNQRMLN